MKTNSRPKTGAFTIEELLVVVVTIGLLAAMLIPVYSKAMIKRDRVRCVDNLKQIGTAFRVWVGDGDLYPLQASGDWGYIVQSGATSNQVNSGSAAAWQVAQSLWNELGTPNKLLCPSDRERQGFRPVTNFNGLAGNSNTLSTASLGHLTNRNNAVSYAFGVAADEARPVGVMVVDRNLNNVGLAGAGIVTNVALTSTRAVLNATVGPTQAVWVTGTPIHGLEGNLAYSDGNARQATSEELRQSLEKAATAYTTVTGQRLVLFP